MPQNKSRKKKKKKKYKFEFSAASLLLSGLGLFLILAWIFILGILVGRGLIPGIEKPLEGKLPLESFLSKGENGENGRRDQYKKLDEEPILAFYEELSSKRAEVAEKTRSGSVALKRGADPEKTKPGQTEKPAPDGYYTLQLASLKTEARANHLVAFLAKKGFRAYIDEANVQEQIYFRVRHGRFKDLKEAHHKRQLLANREGIDGFVVKVVK